MSTSILTVSEFTQKLQQDLQRDIFNALNTQITLTANKLEHAHKSITVNEYTLDNALETIDSAYLRISSIDKLLTALLVITMPNATRTIDDWPGIEALCHSLIEQTESIGADL